MSTDIWTRYAGPWKYLRSESLKVWISFGLGARTDFRLELWTFCNIRDPLLIVLFFWVIAPGSCCLCCLWGSLIHLSWAHQLSFLVWVIFLYRFKSLVLLKPFLLLYYNRKEKDCTGGNPYEITTTLWLGPKKVLRV